MTTVTFRFWEEEGSWWYGKPGATWKFGPFPSQDKALAAAEYLCGQMGWQLNSIFL